MTPFERCESYCDAVQDETAHQICSEECEWLWPEE